MCEIPCTSLSRMILALLILGGMPAWGGTLSEQVYAPPSLPELKAEVDRWIVQKNLQYSPVPDAIAPLWEFSTPPSPGDLFDALMRTYYMVDNDVRELVNACSSWSYSTDLLQLELPESARDQDEPLLTNNTRYFLARHLTLLSAYPEAEQVFQKIDPRHVVDPAGCLFHRAVCEHHLLMKREGLATLALLLNQTEGLPLRYRQLGELMRRDLQEVKEKSLGEVARQMKDVHRRMTLQQSDEGVLEVEARIVATLDELIKKMEDQQQQQGGGAGGTGHPGAAPSTPSQGNQKGGSHGKGLTEKGSAGQKDHWGDLPPKEREAAKNMLDQQFPAHYRQAVEEYLKKLAERPAP